MSVADLHEVGRLLGGIRVHDAAELGRSAPLAPVHPAPVREHAHRSPLEPSHGREELGSVVGLELVPAAGIEEGGEQLFRLVRLPVIRRHDLVGVFRGTRGPTRLLLGRRGARSRKLGEELTQPRDARLVIFDHVVRDPADGGVRGSSAQLLTLHLLPRRALHQVRTAESHEARPLDHDDHVREGRQIRASRNTRPHHGGELRHLEIVPHDRVVVEDPARAVLPRKHAAPGTEGSRPPSRPDR